MMEKNLSVENAYVWSVSQKFSAGHSYFKKKPMSDYYYLTDEIVTFYGIKNVCYFRSDHHDKEEQPILKKLDHILYSIPKQTVATEKAMVEAKAISQLALIQKNIEGAIIDDFSSQICKEASSSSVKEALARVQEALRKDSPHLKLYLVWYAMNFDIDPTIYLPYFDSLSLWVWQYKDLVHLDEYLTKALVLFPDKDIYLGLYTYGYPESCIIPLERIQFSFQKANDYFLQRKIKGIHILGGYLKEELKTEQVCWIREFLRPKHSSK